MLCLFFTISVFFFISITSQANMISAFDGKVKRIFVRNQAFFRFIFPQAARRFIPVYIQETISMLKSTSIVGYIAIQDLTKMSDIIRSRTYEAFFPLIVTAVIYFILAWILSIILRAVLRKIDRRRKRRHGKGGEIRK